MNNPYATPADLETPPRPACEDDWAPFWLLIDRPANEATAAHVAERYCGTCPLRDTHLYETDDPEWAPAAYAIRKQLALIAKKRAADVA